MKIFPLQGHLNIHIFILFSALKFICARIRKL